MREELRLLFLGRSSIPLTVTPSRARPGSGRGLTSIANAPDEYRRPEAEIVLNSLVRRIRASRGNGPVVALTRVSTESTE